MTMMKRAALTAALLVCAGCRGTAPERYGNSSLGFSAVILGARIVTPTGETKDGRLAINFESEQEEYRLSLPPGQTSLFRVEPGIYRLNPTRNVFGVSQAYLTVDIGGHAYRARFPRDILRLDSYDLKPTKAIPVGVLEARLAPAEKGQDRSRRLEVRLDASPITRRKLVEGLIAQMLDPKASSDIRESAVSWTRALEQALIKVQAEERQAPNYKPSK
ncbi:MAG TPA: hypothetical protein VNI01_02190 [Elusimicrobiota bacterium]|jgi:hypothetical protein|nr:hypothetical protein [Elusimicrobiota bacterium]